MNNSNDTTKYYKLYERGMDYIRKKQLIEKTQKNWNFYIGNQWDGIESGGEKLPLLNFIKPIVTHKVATVSQNNMVANYSDAEGREELQPVYEMLNARFSADWEHTNMDMELWATVKDAAITGDGIQYYGTSNVADMQRLPNTSLLYGDESNPNIQQQPYIIIHHRLSISKVKAIAKINGLPDEEIENIVPDQELNELIGNRDEVEHRGNDGEEKVTCIVYLEKIDGIVNVLKCTKNVVFEPLHPIQGVNPDGSKGRGMTLYPIVKLSWEDYPNSARGVSEVEQLIPNQLEYNKTLARWSQIIKLTAYPRIAYDSSLIVNPEDLEKVGAPIEVNSGAQNINQAISYLNPAQSNSDPKNYAENLMSMSQELAGSGETAMGNINPNRVAASAIIAIRDQAALPLNEKVAKKTTFVEDLAKVWVEIWATYHPNGFSVNMEKTDELTGEKQIEVVQVTKEDLDRIRPEIRIDTSQDNPWTKEAEQNWLDGILDKQHITFEEYISVSPDHGIIPKNKMLGLIEKRKAEEQRQMQQEAAGLEAEYGADMEKVQKAWEAKDGNNRQEM